MRRRGSGGWFARVTSETKQHWCTAEILFVTDGNKVYFGPENMHSIPGLCKVRGRGHKISTMSKEEEEKGLITASAGNHAQGVAYAAKLAGVKATVVMPDDHTAD